MHFFPIQRQLFRKFHSDLYCPNESLLREGERGGQERERESFQKSSVIRREAGLAVMKVVSHREVHSACNCT